MVYQFKEVQIQTVDASPPNEVKKKLVILLIHHPRGQFCLGLVANRQQ